MSSLLPARYPIALMIAAGAAAPCALAQQAVIDSPIRAVSPNDAGMYTPVQIDMEALRELCTDDVTIVRHFPVGRGRTLELELSPFEIFTPDASVVIGTETGDVDMGRPDVVLLRGRVAGEEGSSVFLGVSQAMAHGTISVGGEVFYLSSGPWNQAGEILVFNAADLPRASRSPFCRADPISSSRSAG